jgi:molecular chaperone GrpE
MNRKPKNDPIESETHDGPFADGEAVEAGTTNDTAPDDVPQDDRTQLRRERDELFDKLARVSADFQNSRRRLETEADLNLQYANAKLIKSLIPVIDNFERALAVDPAKADSAGILKGLQLVHDQWLTVLRSQNVEVLAPEPGTPFDPSKMEALMQQPSDLYTEPTVTQLFTNGYALHGRTLRPASVAVSKGQ